MIPHRMTFGGDLTNIYFPIKPPKNPFNVAVTEPTNTQSLFTEHIYYTK